MPRRFVSISVVVVLTGLCGDFGGRALAQTTTATGAEAFETSVEPPAEPAFDEGPEAVPVQTQDDDFEAPAPSPGPSVPEPEDAPPAYRNPTGSISLSGTAGVASSREGTSVIIGVGVGYAVFTGVVPGVRGLIISGPPGVGGELAATLTLTPPLSARFTPFVVGEAGRRWEPGLRGWLYGAGGGLYIGRPEASFGLQLGWIFRWIRLDDGRTVRGDGPIVGLSIRFG